MTALGAIAGASLTLAAFHYDGSQPVNVVRLLALLVGLQLALLLLALLLIPGRVLVLRGLQDVVAALNPASLALSLFRWLARRWPGAAALFDRHASRAGAGRFAKWQLLFWSQTAGVAFNIAALATAIVLVTFTDLAFGWSTTLEAEPARVAQIVRAVAWPWHELVPSAVPSIELVEQSQFFRLERSGALPEGASRALTEWWPFTVLAIVTYGLLPRLALLALAAARLRKATAALLLEDPGVTALLDRMGAPEIETTAADHDTAPGDRAGPLPAAPPALADGACAVIWEGSLGIDDARRYARERLGVNVQTIAEAGGGRALSADREALERIAASGARAVLVLTPAWEPPLLELQDFLRELRSRVGDASIVVSPVPDAARAVTDTERDTWTRAMAHLRDPRLYVETGAA